MIHRACAAVAERADPPSCLLPAPPAHVPAARPPPAAAAARESSFSFSFVSFSFVSFAAAAAAAAAPPADARGARSRRLLRPCSPRSVAHHQGTCGRSSCEIACKGTRRSSRRRGVEMFNQEKAIEVRSVSRQTHLHTTFCPSYRTTSATTICPPLPCW